MELFVRAEVVNPTGLSGWSLVVVLTAFDSFKATLMCHEQLEYAFQGFVQDNEVVLSDCSPRWANKRFVDRLTDAVQDVWVDKRHQLQENPLRPSWAPSRRIP